MKRRALISVYDKTDIVEVARLLIEHQFDIIATGGTSTLLEAQGVSVTHVEDLTLYPEILDGRVKTLHPAIFGGILARPDHEQDRKTIQQQQIEPIELVIVNLYPYTHALKEGLTGDALIEMIDIGGVALLRAAAKNYQHVTVIADPNDYPQLIKRLNHMTVDDRRILAGKAFSLTASYDALIAQQFHQDNAIRFPELLTLSYAKVDQPRYGENPHQDAAVYRNLLSSSPILDAVILHGKKLSYNNLRDAGAALHILSEYVKSTVVVVKHLNPCAIASKDTLIDAWHHAHQADPVSIFGGVIATNQVIDFETAKHMNTLFLEVIVAKGYEPEALNLLKQKKNIRLLTYDETQLKDDMQFISIDGGLLYQSKDLIELDVKHFKTVTDRKPSEDEMHDLLFAMRAVRYVSSNAIVIAKHEITWGIGAGQMNRVGAATIAFHQAQDASQGAVLASDGFIPMIDTVTLAYEKGITAIIQPGGSIADQEIIDCCNHYGMAMVFTRTRHFKH